MRVQLILRTRLGWAYTYNWDVILEAGGGGINIEVSQYSSENGMGIKFYVPHLKESVHGEEKNR